MDSGKCRNHCISTENHLIRSQLYKIRLVWKPLRNTTDGKCFQETRFLYTLENIQFFCRCVKYLSVSGNGRTGNSRGSPRVKGGPLPFQRLACIFSQTRYFSFFSFVWITWCAMLVKWSILQNFRRSYTVFDTTDATLHRLIVRATISLHNNRGLHVPDAYRYNIIN